MIRISARRQRILRVLVIVGLVAVPWLMRQAARRGEGQETKAVDSAVEALFEQGVSGRIVQVEGQVDRVLPDDREGSRHQRFILRLPSGHTLLVAHNIDLSTAVPLERGDRVQALGEYEWNDRGGVLHWTHRDPQGRHQPGWILHEGRRHD